MPIRFTCEVTDPHTEAVIGFLGERLNGDTKQMLQVIECVKKWLEMESPIPFDQSLYEQMSSSLVLVTVEGGETSRTVCQTPLESPLA
jgi:hypothetical protein